MVNWGGPGGMGGPAGPGGGGPAIDPAVYGVPEEATDGRRELTGGNPCGGGAGGPPWEYIWWGCA